MNANNAINANALFLFILLYSAVSASAGILPDNAFSDSARGTTTANFLKNPPGARFEALAKGGLVLTGADAFFYNPAGTAFLGRGGSNLSLSYETMLEDGYRSNVSFLKGFGNGWVGGCGLLFFSSGEMDEFNSKGDLTGSFSSYDAAFQTSFAKDFEKIKFGASLKFLRSKIYTESAQSIAMDIGIILPDDRPFSNTKTDLALSIRNIGFPMKLGEERHPLPLEIAGGFLWHYSPNLDILFEGKLPVDHNPYILFAGEYGVFSLVSSELFLRAGYNFKNQSELGFMGGFSSGFGIRIKALTLDYAFVPYGDLGDTHKITFSYGFGKSAEKSAYYKKNIRESYAPRTKKTLAVLNLNNGRDVSKSRSFMVSNILEAEIIKTKKYKILERTDMQFVLAEHKSEYSGLMNDEADRSLEIGKMISADRIIIGGVFKTKKNYIITVKMIDVRTGEVLKSENETATDEYNFRTACKRLAQKITDK